MNENLNQDKQSKVVRTLGNEGIIEEFKLKDYDN